MSDIVAIASAFFKTVREEREAASAHILRGGCVDHAAYKSMVSYLGLLDTLEERIKEIVRNFNGDQPSGP